MYRTFGNHQVEESVVPVLRHEAKADLFRTLGHPVRIRVLELLAEREHAVHELIASMEVEPSTLSQQLGILRRAGIVRQHRIGGEVRYSLMVPSIPDLLAAARTTLGVLLADQAQLQADLDEEDLPASGARP
jgi:ArsR family transcriptional regulator